MKVLCAIPAAVIDVNTIRTTRRHTSGTTAKTLACECPRDRPAARGGTLAFRFRPFDTLRSRIRKESDIPVIGLDVGTGGSRAVIVQPDGSISASATRRTSPSRRPARHGPSRIPTTGGAPVSRRCARCSQQTRTDRSAIRRDRPLGPDARRGAARRSAATCCGRRSSGAISAPNAECRWLDEHDRPQPAARAARSNPALTNFTLTKLLWVRTHEPDVWARVRHVLLPKDYVRFRLSGEHATDVADASGHADARCRAPALVARDARRGGHRRAAAARASSNRRRSARASRDAARRSPASRPARRSSPAPAIRRPARSAWASRGRARSARRSARPASSSRRPIVPRLDPQGPAAHVLSRDSRTLARDGRHAGGRPVAALVPRSVRRGDGVATVRRS